MKKTAFVLLAVLAAGCAHTPLMGGKVSWAQREARAQGYRLMLVGDAVRWVPPPVLSALSAGQVSVQDVRVGDTASYDDAQLCEKLDPSGTAWRKVGDGLILGLGASAVAAGGYSLFNSTDSHNSTDADRHDIQINGDNNTVNYSQSGTGAQGRDSSVVEEGGGQ